MQSAKNICAPLGNSLWEMVLSTGRCFATTQILIKAICIGLLVLLYPIIYYLPRAFPTRSADCFKTSLHFGKIWYPELNKA